MRGHGTNIKAYDEIATIYGSSKQLLPFRKLQDEVRSWTFANFGIMYLNNR
jgi:hypothetical protein